MQIEIFHVQRLTPPLDKRKTTFNDRGGGGRKVPDFVLFLEKTSVVFKKPQFSSKKPQNPSRSRKTPHLVTKPQEWERCRRHLYVCLIYRLHCNRIVFDMPQVAGVRLQPTLQARPRRHINRAGTLPAGTAQCSGSLHY